MQEGWTGRAGCRALSNNHERVQAALPAAMMADSVVLLEHRRWQEFDSMLPQQQDSTHLTPQILLPFLQVFDASDAKYTVDNDLHSEVGLLGRAARCGQDQHGANDVDNVLLHQVIHQFFTCAALACVQSCWTHAFEKAEKLGPRLHHFMHTCSWNAQWST